MAEVVYQAVAKINSVVPLTESGLGTAGIGFVSLENDRGVVGMVIPDVVHAGDLLILQSSDVATFPEIVGAVDLKIMVIESPFGITRL